MSAKPDLTKYDLSVPISKLHVTASGKVEIAKSKKRNEFVPMEQKVRGIPYEWYVTRGRGTKIAYLDTGIDLNHPDLKDGIAAYKDFTGEGIMEKTVTAPSLPVLARHVKTARVSSALHRKVKSWQ